MSTIRLLIKFIIVLTLLFFSLASSVDAQADTIRSTTIKKAEIGTVNVQEIGQYKLEYKVGERLKTDVKVSNFKKTSLKMHLVWEVLDSHNSRVIKTSQTVYLNSGEHRIETLSCNIPNMIGSGYYSSRVYGIIPPESFNALPILIIDSSENAEPKGFQIFKGVDSFEDFDLTMWEKSNHLLGRSKLNEELISVYNGNLVYELQSSSFYGGEIHSANKMGFGLYEAKMKLPFAPSSITGFFLYEPPDYFHEIDIEIINDASGIYYLTTYFEGKMSNTYEGKLGFDPTTEYHLYKIDYQQDYVAFYIDNQLVKRWSTNIPQKSMRLFLNVWYPTWLDGESLKSNTKLMVDWIKY